jgi:hypothetical protein
MSEIIPISNEVNTIIPNVALWGIKCNYFVITLI